MMKKAVITALFSLFLAAAFPTAAYAQELVVGGQVVGIQISTAGVMVAGVAQVETAEGCCSPASEAGIKEGDVITVINGVATPTVAVLQEQIARYRPGDKIKVEFVRGKDKKSADVVLKNSYGNTEVTKAMNIDMLGATLKEPDDALKAKLQIRGGVEVVKLKEGQFKKAGIRENFVILDINGARIAGVKDVENLFLSIMKGQNTDKVMFIKGLYPNGKSGYYAVPLAE